jgi:hypothetical protein
MTSEMSQNCGSSHICQTDYNLLKLRKLTAVFKNSYISSQIKVEHVCRKAQFWGLFYFIYMTSLKTVKGKAGHISI